MKMSKAVERMAKALGVAPNVFLEKCNSLPGGHGSRDYTKIGKEVTSLAKLDNDRVFVSIAGKLYLTPATQVVAGKVRKATVAYTQLVKEEAQKQTAIKKAKLLAS